MRDHLVHVHKDRAFLLDAATEYFQAGRSAGEAGIVIARPALRESLAQRLPGLQMLDAERTLSRVMVGTMPDWTRFLAVIGGLIAQVRLNHSGVRAYGEMVDVLWQAGNKEGALRLEEFWNELARLQTFSLFCAYELDSLEQGADLERICAAHTHLVSARDHALVDDAVERASEDVLEQPLSRMLLTMASAHRHGARVPAGHATLLWLHRNMPRAAARVLARVRASIPAEAA